MAQEQQAQVPGRRGRWWRVLLTGLFAFFLGIAVLILTANPIIFPTVVMIGSFTVPVTYVAFFYERRHLSQLNMPTTAMGFLYGGVLGVFASALLEPLLVHELNFFSIFVIGLIEEFTKIPGIMLIARRRRHDLERDGLILGAAAGMGFASLESTGYAFTAFLASQGSLSITVELTLLRGFLAPVGHGTWTAILTGVLFRESAAGRFHLNRRVLGAYLTVSILHGLWDGLPGLMAALLFPGFDILIGQACVGSIGFFVLWLALAYARLNRYWHKDPHATLALLYVPSQLFPASEARAQGCVGILEQDQKCIVERVAVEAGHEFKKFSPAFRAGKAGDTFLDLSFRLCQFFVAGNRGCFAFVVGHL